MQSCSDLLLFSLRSISGNTVAWLLDYWSLVCGDGLHVGHQRDCYIFSSSAVRRVFKQAINGCAVVTGGILSSR